MPRAQRRDVLAAAAVPLEPLPVRDDYGPIGQGASQARSVSTGTGEYLVKGPSLAPDNRYVAANEYVGAKLARRLGLPILGCEIVELNGAVLFGSEYMPNGTWHPAITEPLFQAAQNQEAVYLLVAFDAWIVNGDRHPGNLLVRTMRATAATAILLNDHSHCLVTPPSPPNTPGTLAGLTNAPVSRFVTGIGFIREAVTNPTLLGAAIAQVEAVTIDQIRATLESAHPAWFADPVPDRLAYLRFLANRRTRLRSLFDAERGIFPNLAGGPI